MGSFFLATVYLLHMFNARASSSTALVLKSSHAFSTPMQMMPFVNVIPERHVGVYYWNGALQPGVFEPGLHWHLSGLGSRKEHIFVGIDRDRVPPQGSREKYLSCRSKDGSSFKFILEVSNRLHREHVWETIKVHGLRYDEETIYNQAEPAMKDVCANMTADEIALHKYHELDDRVREQLILRQAHILKSNVEIVQVKIVEMVVPRDLDDAYQKQAAARARRAALIEERLADQEAIRNEQAKADGMLEIKRRSHEADLELQQKAAEADAKMLILKAEAQRNATLIEAKADAESKGLDAKANQAWLSEAQLRRLESEQFSVLTIIKKVKAAWR
mmetsp:Transcript_135002/g.238832  ORF Transcript_135002/g.238832 Transcript_135002/m.238832 type:complete len:332 (+) Transcript_135002:92-1087(+)